MMACIKTNLKKIKYSGFQLNFNYLSRFQLKILTARNEEFHIMINVTYYWNSVNKQEPWKSDDCFMIACLKIKTRIKNRISAFQLSFNHFGSKTKLSMVGKFQPTGTFKTITNRHESTNVEQTLTCHLRMRISFRDVTWWFRVPIATYLLLKSFIYFLTILV